eukprot:8077405-Alexandrium_andersonii.AAC.1
MREVAAPGCVKSSAILFPGLPHAVFATPLCTLGPPHSLTALAHPCKQAARSVARLGVCACFRSELVTVRACVR